MTLIGLATRNLGRNKFRTILTVVGVAMATFTFVLLRTVLNSWEHSATLARNDLLVTRNQVSYLFPVPVRYIEDVKAIPGVDAATGMVWFGGRDPKHDRETFLTLAVSDIDSYLATDREMVLSPEAKTAWKENRRGAVVGDVLAQQLGYKIGDRVTLESGKYPAPRDNPWTFEIVGIYKVTTNSVDRRTFFFRYDYLNEYSPSFFKDRIGWVYGRLRPSQDADQVLTLIDQHFKDREIATTTTNERSFRSNLLAGLRTILSVLSAVSVIILAIIGLILGNTLAMGIRERTQEHGVLRAIGFTSTQVSRYILGEALFTGILGGLLGLAIAYPVIQIRLAHIIEDKLGPWFPYFRLEPSVMLLGATLPALLAVAAAGLPTFQMLRLPVTDALRRVV